MGAHQVLEIHMLDANMAIEALLRRRPEVARITGKLFKAFMHGINVSSQMTNDWSFEIALQALGPISFMDVVQMVLE